MFGKIMLLVCAGAALAAIALMIWLSLADIPGAVRIGRFFRRRFRRILRRAR